MKIYMLCLLEDGTVPLYFPTRADVDRMIDLHDGEFDSVTTIEVRNRRDLADLLTAMQEQIR